MCGLSRMEYLSQSLGMRTPNSAIMHTASMFLAEIQDIPCSFCFNLTEYFFLKYRYCMEQYNVHFYPSGFIGFGKAEDNSCPCSPNTIQSGHHITFTCPLHSAARTSLIGNKRSWEDLDTPHTITLGDEEAVDGVILFFEYLFDQLT